MKKQKISLCMIVLNEEDTLKRSLSNVAGHVDEMVIIDGGSTDKSVEVAKSFGAKVYHKKWADHFGNQRNFGLKKATGDWILVMDADEVFDRKLLEALPSLVSNNIGIEIFAFPRKNYLDGKQTEDYPDKQSRLFKNNGKIKYHGRLHEIPVGYVRLAAIGDAHIIHKKSWERQKKQNRRYNKIIKEYFSK